MQIITENVGADIQKKELDKRLESLGCVAVAFSGGVDSAFLLKTAHDVLGDRAFAVMAKADSFPDREVSEAEKFCENEGITLYTVTIDLTAIDGFSSNPANRCYICKKAIFGKIIETAFANGADCVVEGSNLDDDCDYRPGMAAIRELGVLSPLSEVGLTKAKIRELSRKMGLCTWNKPSFACLATRIPYGEEITSAKLAKIGEAESFLADLGFGQVRVRVCKNTARIEIMPYEFHKIIEADIRAQINAKFKEIGFDYTALDLLGYRSGSMNEVLEGNQ